MTVSLRNGVLQIQDISIENPLVAEYLETIPAAERENAVIRALGIGVMAELKGEIGHFLHQTEGELGKHLSSLKALYDLRSMRFQTSQKGADAEVQVISVLNDFKDKAGFLKDEVRDLGRLVGAIPRNRTGDVLVEVDGDPRKAIGIEVKLDGGVKMGEILNRDPIAKTDTAVGQLIETAANRNTTLNIIVFDEDSVDTTVSQQCVEGIRYLAGIGFIVIVSTRRNDFRTLALVYLLARDLVLAEPKQAIADHHVLEKIVERLVQVLNDYTSTRKDAETIIKSARKIISQSERTLRLVENTRDYLKHYLETGELSQQQMLEFYQAKGVAELMRDFEREVKNV
jgi:hypothetical protein